VDEVVEARRARLRVRLGAAAVLVLVALGGVVLAAVLTDPGSSIEVAPTAVAPVTSGAVLYIHVLGAVERAGLYEVREGDRVIDAIAAAGGFRDDADQGQLNLARRLVDGEQLVVPVQGATPAAPGSADGRINLNTADAASLDTLPRVGPAMAARIIAYRDTNGPFTSVDDLLGVTGIGEKTLEGLRDLVTL
jgi:competence protein ComEA